MKLVRTSKKSKVDNKQYIKTISSVIPTINKTVNCVQFAEHFRNFFEVLL